LRYHDTDLFFKLRSDYYSHLGAHRPGLRSKHVALLRLLCVTLLATIETIKSEVLREEFNLTGYDIYHDHSNYQVPILSETLRQKQPRTGRELPSMQYLLKESHTRRLGVAKTRKAIRRKLFSGHHRGQFADLNCAILYCAIPLHRPIGSALSAMTS